MLLKTDIKSNVHEMSGIVDFTSITQDNIRVLGQNWGDSEEGDRA